MKKIAVFLAIFMLFGLASQASAITIGFNDDTFVGIIVDGIPPSGYASYVSELIEVDAGTYSTTSSFGQEYDRTNSNIATSDLPDVEGGAFKYDIDTGDLSLLEGFQYILGKYDGPNDGVYVWFFENGLPEDCFLPTKSPLNLGLSNIAGINGVSVPEPGTVMLLGIGLVGLAGLGRKRLFKK